MVYMKKGTPAKNQQQQFKKGKKAVQVQQEEENDFEEMDDSDDDDSDEAPQLTPTNKGMKGRQSMSEKKVSFAIPGKNSPAVKTPKKDNSILVKKQPTPANKGKTAMQEFKGMKGKQAQEEDDDDDDDEDDDDFDIDEDEEDDLDLDIDEDEGDEDEEDDDEDDDDEEDDDDNEEEGEEEKASIQKKLSLLKQSNAQQTKQKTPVKGDDKAKKAESPVKGQTPKKEQAAKAAKVPQLISDEVERRRERDAKMLYVGGLPKDTTEEELKSLSNDIVDVTIPLGNRKKGSAKTMFAFLNFNTEAKAESNYKTLQSKKFRGQPLTLDFVGFKSKNRKIEDESAIIFNMKKLFVGGVPADATIDQLAKFFKKAFSIHLSRGPSFRTAAINFDTEEDAKEAHDANKEIVLSGHKLPVLYSRVSGQPDSRKRKRNNRSNKRNMVNKNNTPNKNNTNNGANPAKKMKFSKPE